MSTAVDIALALNILADLYFRFKAAGVEVRPETLKNHIDALEKRAEANNAALGVTGGSSEE